MFKNRARERLSTVDAHERGTQAKPEDIISGSIAGKYENQF